MSTSDVNDGWAIAIIVLIPAIVIIAAELDERLRQRESPLRPAVATLRTWGLPFFAVWALLVPVFGLDDDHSAVRIAGTGLVIVLGLVGMSVLRVVIEGIRSAERAGTRRATPQLLLALPRIAFALLVFWLLVAGVWGVDLSAALTALGVTSLVISFALQDTLSGLASGVLLLSDQPFKTGDWIRVGDTEGRVTDINWRTSRIEARDGSLIVVPNSELAGASLVNFSAPSTLHRITVPVSVAYINPPTRAREMLLDAARATPGVLLDPEPVARVTLIDDPLMGYEVQMWVDDYTIVPRVESEFGALVWYQSHRHNVPLPSPAQDLYLYDGNAEAAASGTPIEELQHRLRCSPLLATLHADRLDELAAASTAERFKSGESIVRSDAVRRDPIVLVEGSAQLMVDDGIERTVAAEIARGDLIGVIKPEAEGVLVVVEALTDCETVRLQADVATRVISQDAALSDAVNQVLETRMRRVDRVLEQRSIEVTRRDADR